MKIFFEYLKNNKFIFDNLKLENHFLFNECADTDIFELNFLKSNPLLHLACSSEGSSEELIEFLIDQGADINEKNAFNSTPFHIALRRRNEQICKILIEKGVNVNLCTQTGLNPIQISSMYGLVEVTKQLLSLKVNIHEPTTVTLMTPLHLAASNGHADVTQLLLSEIHITEDFNYVDSKDKYGNTALFLACKGGFKLVVQILLDAKADILCKNNMQASVLFAAVYSGQYDVVNAIINKIPEEHKLNNVNGFTVINDLKRFANLLDTIEASSSFWNYFFNHLQPYQSTETPWLDAYAPLHVASELGHNDLVKLLITSGAIVNSGNFLGITALHMASKEGHCDIINNLLANGGMINAQTFSGNTPLIEATIHNHLYAVSLLLQNEADANIENIHGNIPLHYAANYGFTECVALLLPKTTNINSKNNASFTSLMVSAQRGHFSIVKLLLEYTAEVDQDVWQNPLTLSLQKDKTAVATLLLESFTLSNISNPGLPYLHCAVYKNNTNFVEILLQKGVSANLKNNNGYSALHISAMEGHIECAEVLVNHGADIEARAGIQLFTALHIATMNNNMTMVKFLLAKGANINCHGKDFETPLELAAIHLGNLEMVKVLLENGTKLNLIGQYMPIFFEAVVFNKCDIVKAMLEADSNDITTGANVKQLESYDKIRPRSNLFSGRNTEPKKFSYNQIHNQLYDSILKYKKAMSDYVHALRNNQQVQSKLYSTCYGVTHIIEDAMQDTPIPKANIEFDTQIYQGIKINESAAFNVKRSGNSFLYFKSRYDEVELNLLKSQTAISNDHTNTKTAADFKPQRLCKSVSDNNISYSKNEHFGKETLVSMRDFQGNTALHWAAITGNLVIGKLLTSAGADTNVYSNCGLTPIALAAEQKTDFVS